MLHNACAQADAHSLREALAPYVNLQQLRQLAAKDSTLLEAALTGVAPTPEVAVLLGVLAAVLRPAEREQVTSPAEIAALLMVEMGMLPQEQLRVVCLNTKNYVQAIVTLYQGSVNRACVRVAEVFREPVRRTSAAIIVAHNHPSGEPTPSPEDVLLTRQIREAGKLLDIDVLDHLIIGQGRWVSLRERRLGFDS